MRIAALDIGTNTVLLLIADVEGETFHVMRDDHAIARLGEGVDRTHRISDAAYERFISILREHQKTIAEFNCERIIAAATSAMRDAENREEIIERTKRDTGIEIKILSGEEEARLTYRGAVAGMTFPPPNEGGGRGWSFQFDKTIPQPPPSIGGGFCVVDIGGGSTEISIGNGEVFESGVSLDIGAVRITERYFSMNPILPEVRETARSAIRKALDHPPAPSYSAPLHRRGSMVIAVAGTPTTLAALHQKLPAFDVAKVHGYILTRQAIGEMMDILFTVSTAELLERFPAVNKARADILPAGTLILAEVMDRLGAEQITVSTQGLRYGIALSEPG
jgi:exopolyphosphatase/guanosine-5'-triphosphate,3'-diphosphate pyrophosphatase